MPHLKAASPATRPGLGFTLLEVCLAISISLLLIGVAAPSLIGLLTRKKAESSFAEFDELVRKAHTLSMEERKPYVLLWDKEGVVLRPDESAGGEEAGRFGLDKKDALTLDLTAALRKNPGAIWTFWPSGACEPATVSFKGKIGSWSAVYDPFTARATVTYDE